DAPESGAPRLWPAPTATHRTISMQWPHAPPSSPANERCPLAKRADLWPRETNRPLGKTNSLAFVSDRSALHSYSASAPSASPARVELDKPSICFDLPNDG